ncbi:MAG TPA: hypothetical protein VF454_00815, partial [Gemmatimonadales bacterium]
MRLLLRLLVALTVVLPLSSAAAVAQQPARTTRPALKPAAADTHRVRGAIPSRTGSRAPGRVSTRPKAPAGRPGTGTGVQAAGQCPIPEECGGGGEDPPPPAPAVKVLPDNSAYSVTAGTSGNTRT